ncbi:MAG TPA: glycosyltransferase family A protein [Solirubrobacterales bacterium]|nr:glycosyltransferase family A protein [Solirubrobacterales bacterium]
MNVAILIPTLGRPHALQPLLTNLRQTTEFRYRVYFVVDQDDQETRDVIDKMPGFDFTSVLCDGTYPEKSNAGHAASADEELILPTADDVVFHDGWLQAVLPHFEAGWQVVGTCDTSPITEDGGHVTMPILRRSYIEDPGAVWGEPGKVFFEGYHHSRVETELWHLALHRDVAIFERESVIEHLHPEWSTRPVDDTDRKGQMRNREADDALFHARKAEWEKAA